MSYWKSKVLPKFKKLLPQGKKKAAAEACKTFDSSKESLDKEIEEKTSDLQLKVVEIYKASAVVTKKLLKDPNEAVVKDCPKEVQGVLKELAKAGFPGAQVVSEYGSKYGPALVPGPIVYIFNKTSTFLVEEPLPAEPAPEPEPEPREAPIEGGPSEEKKEEVIEEKKEEVVEEKKEEVIEEKKEEEPTPCTNEEVAVVEEKKEEVVAVVEEKKEEVVEKKEEVVEKKEEAIPPPAC